MVSHREHVSVKDSGDAVDLSEVQPLSAPGSPLGSNHARILPQPESSQGIGILVMGLTGAGKSTFISQITQQNIEIGHSLGSCTSTVYGYRYFHTNGQEIWLIDTPGFDDTNKANVQILGDIATFLSIFCSEHRLIIGGMLYIHRITDVRMSNSSIKSLRIFEALCGDACFKDVTIITTMWDLLQTPDALQAAERREAALKSRDNFLGRLITGGAQYARHKDARSSSIEVIENVVNRQRKVVLALQEELQRDSATTLVDTTVGKYLEGDLRDMRKKYETKIAQLEAYNDTLVDNDDDMRAAVTTEKELMLNIESNIHFLHQTFENLRNERGIEMVEEGRITANGKSKAAPVEDISNLNSDGWTKNTEPHLPLQLEGMETDDANRRYQYAQNHAEDSVRETDLKDKPKKDSAWSDFLRAMLGLSEFGKGMFHETRRSGNHAIEAGEYRASMVSRPKKTVQHRERRVQSRAAEAQHPTQTILHDNWNSSDPKRAEQTDFLEAEHHQEINHESLPKPPYQEIVPFSPEPLVAPGRLPYNVVWSNIPRSY